jgi:hypothetical protein
MWHDDDYNYDYYYDDDDNNNKNNNKIQIMRVFDKHTSHEKEG